MYFEQIPSLIPYFILNRENSTQHIDHQKTTISTPFKNIDEVSLFFFENYVHQNFGTPPFKRMLRACSRALIRDKNQMVDVTLPIKVHYMWKAMSILKLRNVYWSSSSWHR